MNPSESDFKTPQPIPIGQPLPHRKVIRQWLEPLVQRQTLTGIMLLIFDWLLFLGFMTGVVMLQSYWLKAFLAVLAGLVIGRLFIIGHDACHQSYTPHRNLNRWLGRIAMIPSLTPYSLWEVGHNVVHHGYTNLKGVDFVWAPLSKEEYEALSPTRQWLERLYRSGWGPAFYYLIEMWWNRMYFPKKSYMGTKRPEFTWDGVFVSLYALFWIGLMVVLAWQTQQSVWGMVLVGFVLPFMVWNAMIGFVVYIHHTHTAVQWHDDKARWSKAAPFVSTTVHISFPMNFGGMMHHIMEHTAHHVDMSIPLYRLKQAQKLLEDTLPGRIIIEHFSWRWYFETARKCKLYDFTKRCWTDFQGRPTSDIHPQIA